MPLRTQDVQDTNNWYNFKLSALKSTFKRKEKELNASLSFEKVRADKAEKESGFFRQALFGLQKQLDEQNDEETIINEFKNSEDYDLALVNAGAPEIERC